MSKQPYRFNHALPGSRRRAHRFSAFSESQRSPESTQNGSDKVEWPDARAGVILYTLTLGDEFQAVFATADHVFDDIVQILGALHPDQVRFSLGLGNITTELNLDQALGMDGPAFYRARDGIEQLKDSGDLLRLVGLPDRWAALAQGSLRLLSKWIQKWEANRLAVLHGLLSGDPVKAISTDLGVTEQAVYKNIRSGGLDAVIEVLSALTDILNNCLSEPESIE